MATKTDLTRQELMALRVLIKTRIAEAKADAFDNHHAMVGSAAFWQQVLEKLQ